MQTGVVSLGRGQGPNLGPPAEEDPTQGSEKAPLGPRGGAFGAAEPPSCPSPPAGGHHSREL